jgi:hypothetical protein
VQLPASEAQAIDLVVDFDGTVVEETLCPRDVPIQYSIVRLVYRFESRPQHDAQRELHDYQ